MDIKTITNNISSRLGIQQLNPMQQKMLKSDSRRVILIAPTGSGKTVAFACKMLKYLSAPSQRVKSIIIAPSRELVIQIGEIVRQIAIGYKTVTLYGGHSMLDERNSLTPLPDIIVTTPGRLLDHLQRGNLIIESLETLVLDEYDKSLELGFEQEMKRIVNRIGRSRNIILTSATSMDEMPKYFNVENVELIKFGQHNDPRQRMQVVHVVSFTADKLDTLCNLLRTLPFGERTIIFVNHRESAERVYKRLKSDKITAGLYHGALDQEQRATAIDLLTNGSTPIMIATDLASRGLDIAGVNNVIHYHIPISEQAWTHRNGRTARIEESGNIYVITSENDSVPDYMVFDRDFIPTESSPRAMYPNVTTLYFAAGKKEKISRGDIVGFLTANTSLTSNEIGKIALRDHNALVAIPRDKLHDIIKSIAEQKIKGKKIKISPLKI